MPTTISVPIRILLFDDESLVRAGLRMLLEYRPGFKVIAQAGENGEALRLAEQEQPDIILLHENSGNTLRLGLLPQLMAVLEKPRIILMTPKTNSQYHVQAVQNGAMGVVLSQHSPDVLYKAIEKVYEGEVWLDRNLVARVLVHNSARQKSDTIPNRIALLSERERKIISLVGAGLKNQQIADNLFLSEVTVRHHLTSIFRKINVSDRLELLIFAYQNGLAQLPV